jgi:hypothetical protein
MLHKLAGVNPAQVIASHEPGIEPCRGWSSHGRYQRNRIFKRPKRVLGIFEILQGAFRCHLLQLQFRPEPLAKLAAVRTTGGANQQKALKFHCILDNPLTIKNYRGFSISQILPAFKGSFLRAYNPTESIIFSSEKSYSPCKLKWLHRITESLRMASMSSFLRSSLLSLQSSFVR